MTKVNIFIPSIRSDEKRKLTADSLKRTDIPSGFEMEVFFISEGKSYAEAINFAYEKYPCDWFFCGGDDLDFHPQWLKRALDKYKETGKLVIGTNDLHHPGTLIGDYATHYFVNKEYITRYGGTFDGSYPVLYNYKHNYTDTEFIEKAKAVKQFAGSIESVVEHLHPVWGRALNDEVYEKGQRTSRDDQAVYEKRLYNFKNPQ